MLAVSVAGKGMKAIGWRVAAGRNAGLGARLLALGATVLALALAALMFF